jgi:hypothetical protein
MQKRSKIMQKIREEIVPDPSDLDNSSPDK